MRGRKWLVVVAALGVVGVAFHVWPGDSAPRRQESHRIPLPPSSTELVSSGISHTPLLFDPRYPVTPGGTAPQHIPTVILDEQQRETRVDELRVRFRKEFSGPGAPVRKVVLDCQPDSPFLVIFEEDSSYNAQLMAEDLRELLRVVARDFRDRFQAFPGIRESSAFAVNVIYMFPNEDRLRACTGMPRSMGHAFHFASGIAYGSKDSRTLYENLAHDAIHQLVLNLAVWIAGDEAPPVGCTMYAMSEGLAMYFENFTRLPDGSLKFASPESPHAPMTRILADAGRLRRPDEILEFSWEAQVAASKSPMEAQRLQAGLWSVTLFLNQAAEGRYRALYDEYLDATVHGKGGMESAKRIFGDLEVLNAEYVEFCKSLK